MRFYDDRDDEYYIPYEELMSSGTRELLEQFFKNDEPEVAIYWLLDLYDYQIKVIDENGWMAKILILEVSIEYGYLPEYLKKEVKLIIEKEWLPKLWRNQGVPEEEILKRKAHLESVYGKIKTFTAGDIHHPNP